MKKSSAPTPDWGPALLDNRTGKYADYDLRRIATYQGDIFIGNVSVIRRNSGSAVELQTMNSDGLTKRITAKNMKEVENGGVDNVSFHL